LATRVCNLSEGPVPKRGDGIPENGYPSAIF
jgi:hypothetical protein